MIDLGLTESGDIAWSSIAAEGRFHLTFSLAKYKTQRVNFLCIPSSRTRRVNDIKGQRVRFQFSDMDIEYELQNSLVKDDNEKLQSMFIELKTEIGDVSDDTVGSKFYQNRHKIISKTNDLNNIRDEALKVTQKYFPEAKLTAEFVICPEAGNFQHQSVKLTLTDKNNKTIATFAC